MHSAHSDFGNETFLFYFDGPSVAKSHVFHHSEVQQENKKECENFAKYMNEKVAPHELRCISVYEDNHPQPQGQENHVNLTMIHSAGEEIEDLSKRYGTAAGVSPDYRVKHIVSEHLDDPWTEAFRNAETWMNASEQAGMGFAVTAYNRSSEDSACVYILYWNLANNEFFSQAGRPTDCCAGQCLIF